MYLEATLAPPTMVRRVPLLVLLVASAICMFVVGIAMLFVSAFHEMDTRPAAEQ